MSTIQPNACSMEEEAQEFMRQLAKVIESVEDFVESKWLPSENDHYSFFRQQEIQLCDDWGIPVDHSEVSQCLSNVGRALNAVEYHRANIRRIEAITIKTLEEHLLKQPEIATGKDILWPSFSHNILSYEYEAYLFAGRRCLDYLLLLVAQTFDIDPFTSPDRSRTKPFQGLSDEIKQRPEISAKKITNRMKQFRSKAPQFYKERNTSAHIEPVVKGLYSIQETEFGRFEISCQVQQIVKDGELLTQAQIIEFTSHKPDRFIQFVDQQVRDLVQFCYQIAELSVEARLTS